MPDGGSPAFAKTMKKQIYGYNWDVTVLGIEKEIRTLMLMLRREKGK